MLALAGQMASGRGQWQMAGGKNSNQANKPLKL
jgi:hypothetical protein